MLALVAPNLAKSCLIECQCVLAKSRLKSRLAVCKRFQGCPSSRLSASSRLCPTAPLATTPLNCPELRPSVSISCCSSCSSCAIASPSDHASFACASACALRNRSCSESERASAICGLIGEDMPPWRPLTLPPSSAVSPASQHVCSADKTYTAIAKQMPSTKHQQCRGSRRACRKHANSLGLVLAISAGLTPDRVGDPDGVLGSSPSRSASELRIRSALPCSRLGALSVKDRSTSSFTRSMMCSPAVPSPLARFARRGEIIQPDSFAAASVRCTCRTCMPVTHLREG